MSRRSVHAPLTHTARQVAGWPARRYTEWTTMAGGKPITLQQPRKGSPGKEATPSPARQPFLPNRRATLVDRRDDVRLAVAIDFCQCDVARIPAGGEGRARRGAKPSFAIVMPPRFGVIMSGLPSALMSPTANG